MIGPLMVQTYNADSKLFVDIKPSSDDFLDQSISYNEVETALKQVKLYKAPGFDGITTNIIIATYYSSAFCKPLYSKNVSLILFPIS